MAVKSFGKISLVGTGNVLNALFGFAFLTVVARSLDIETFGKYALLSTLLLTISKLVDFGANSVSVARSITEEDKNLPNSLYTLKIIQFFISIPISLITLNLLGINNLLISGVFILGIFAYTINYLFYALFQMKEKFAEMVLINTLPQTIKLIFAGLILSGAVAPSLNITFGIFSLSMFATLFLLRRLPDDARSMRFDLTNVTKLFKQSYPAGFSQIVYESWGSINNIIAKTIKGFGDVGILSLANKISNIFSLVSLSVFAVLLPKNAKSKLKGTSYDYIEAGTIAVSILILAFISIGFSEIFIVKIFGTKFSGSVKLLDILIFASAISSIHSFLENLFFVENKTNYIFAITSVKLFSYLVSALILVPGYSIYGICWANLVSALAGLIATIGFISRFKHQAV